MSNIAMSPPPKILEIAEKLDQVIGQFLLAFKSIPPLGKFESEVEARLLFILAIRSIEAMLTLARTDLVLLPAANILARAVFEASLKSAWMVQPADPFDGEVRWLAHLSEAERLYKSISKNVADSGGNSTFFDVQHQVIKDFRVGVSNALPPQYSELKGNPSIEAMLRDLGQEHMYFIYRHLSQFVHAGHVSTGLYRTGLGTGKRGGEFITQASWHSPLWNAWNCLQIFGSFLLKKLKAEQPQFVTRDDIAGMDMAFAQLVNGNETVN